MKMNKSSNSVSRKSGSKNNISDKIKLKSSFKKQKVLIDNNSQRCKNNSIEILNGNIDLYSDSLKSNSYHSSHFKTSKFHSPKNLPENKQIPIININQENEEEENDKVTNLANNEMISKSFIKNIIKINTNSAFSFKNDNQSSKFLKMSKNSTDIINNGPDSKKLSDKTLTCESFEKQDTIKYSNKSLLNTIFNNNDEDSLFVTLEDVNKNFSKKIKKR
jgi:hypothetical protein